MTRAIGHLVLLLTLMRSAAVAQELTLQKDCETGFRQLIQMAQSGALGADVANANVRVDGKRVEVELVRGSAASKFFQLRPKASAQAWSRYFDIIPGSGASEADAERLGQALNLAFAADPFVIVVMEGGRGDDPVPGILAAWRYGGWYGAARVIERRMMVLVSVRYTVSVIVALAIGVTASLVLLFFSIPPAPTGNGPPLGRLD